MAYRMKGFSGFKNSPAKAGAQSVKETVTQANLFNPDDPKNKLDGDKISTQNKHTKASSGVTDISQYEVRENKTRNQ